MNLKTILFNVVFFLNVSSLEAVTDYFGTSRLSFLGNDYNLVWSAHSHNGTKIEDFIPNGPSYTQFEKKISVYFMKNTSFEKTIMEKQYEVERAKQEGQIIEAKNQILTNNEILCSYTSELSQDGVLLVVQFTVMRYIKMGSDVVLLEWQHRSYKNAESFKKSIAKNQDFWEESVAKFDIENFKF